MRSPLWLLPGMDATGLLWGPLVDAIGPREDVRAFSYPEGVVRYDEVLELVGAPPPGATLIAESFSGPAAIRLAHAHPDRVRALVLVSSFARGSRAPLLFGRVLEAAMALRPPTLAVRALMVGLDAPDVIVELVRAALLRVPPATMLERVRETARTDVRSELAALRCPVIWLQASHDRLVPARATREARVARPGLDVRMIEGPHLLAQTRAQEVARVLATL
jgi:pimeloyl-[acyl-carrier protein] methyl ester esterase